MVHTIEFITSASSPVTGKVVLWRRGNYQYQIEVTKNGISNSRNFEAEYDDALEMFKQSVDSLSAV